MADPRERALLNSAHDELERLLGHDVGPWAVTNRLERRRSTIDVLAADHRRGTTIAYLKRARPSTKSDQRRAADELAHRMTLERELVIRDDARRLLGADGFGYDYPLAVDVDTLTGVRLGVDGTELGKSRLGIGRRTWPYERIGALIGTIERVGAGLDPRLTVGERDAWAKGVIERCAGSPNPHALRAIERRLTELLDRHAESFSWLWTHGDMSRTNLMRDGK